MPDGAVIIAAITSCTNTGNPRNVVAAACWPQGQRPGPDAQAVGKDLAGARLQELAKLYLEDSGLLPDLEKLGFGIVAYACTTCNGMSGALDPEIRAGDHRPRPVRHRRALGQPQL